MPEISVFKNEGMRIKNEVQERVASYIMGGLGIVVGLAWNEAIKGLIEYIFPPSGTGTLMAKFLYAFILTLIVVVVTVYLLRPAKDKMKDRDS
ncbi:MAG: hypothetical protein UY42_C0001G0034 [Parcubacteria group bacterium GW2011_GWA2_49_16]|nr:MAG: hypothetical protein UY42_C0001G0034 [Parcubacteria group bacterium GW2011_GWA2_49_16]